MKSRRVSAPLGHLTAPTEAAPFVFPSESARWLQAIPPAASQVVSKCTLRIKVEANAHICYNLIIVNRNLDGGVYMLTYSVMMFLTTALIILLSIAIYKGKTNLIYSYHQTKVTDKSAYGKAFGKALLGVAMAPLFSGIVGLLGDSEVIAIIAVAVLVIGIGIGIGFIVGVQKKYNKGIF